MVLNIIPLLLLGGGAVYVVAAGKKKKKKTPEKKAPLVIEPKKPPIVEPRPPVPKPPVECATRIDASATRIDIYENVKNTRRPVIMAGTCNGNGFNVAYDKVCKEYSGEVDFILARVEDASDPKDRQAAAAICEALNNGALLVVGRPAVEDWSLPESGLPPVATEGVMIFDYEEIPDLRFDPTKVKAEFVIAKALDYAKGATHPSSRFFPFKFSGG